MLTIHLRVNDATTGKPTPVRLRVTGADGTYFAPFGHATEFARGRNEDVGGNLCVGRERFAYIDGSCEIKLPVGVPLRVQATKGPEFEPLDQTVSLGPGKMALRFALKRWSDLRTDGWHTGDTRAHFLTPHAAALEAAAEDISVVNLLACTQPFPSLDGTLYPSFPNLTAFSGQQPALQTASALVAVNTLNVHPVLGSVGLLHSHRVVYPLAFGGDDTDDWSVSDWCDQCHRKNGLTVWTDWFNPVGGEALVALILGKIDAIEYDGRPRKLPFLRFWYRLLNAGFRIPVVGGSGKDSNAVPLGTPRTYARLNPGEPLTYTGWIEAVRAGRCFVTNGPLLRFDGESKGPGETLDLPNPGTPIRLRASAGGLNRFERLEILAHAQVIASAPGQFDGSRWSAAVEAALDVTEPGWVAARCVGGATPNQPAFAHTAPTYLRVAGRYRREPTSLTALRRMVEQTREWVELHGRFAEQKRKRHLLDLCDAALAKLATSETPTG